jgi:hypothetical protein
MVNLVMVKPIFCLGFLFAASASLNAMRLEHRDKYNALLRMCLFYTTPDNNTSNYNAEGIQGLAVTNESELFYSCVFSWGRLDSERIKDVEKYMEKTDFYWIEDKADQEVSELNYQCLNKHGYRFKEYPHKLNYVAINNYTNNDYFSFDLYKKIKRARSTEELELWWQTLGQCFTFSEEQLLSLKSYIQCLSLGNNNYNFWTAYYNNKPVAICMTIIFKYDKEMTLHFATSILNNHLMHELLHEVTADARRNNVKALWFLSSSLASDYFDKKDISSWNNSLGIYRKISHEEENNRSCILF